MVEAWFEFRLLCELVTEDHVAPIQMSWKYAPLRWWWFDKHHKVAITRCLIVVSNWIMKGVLQFRRLTHKWTRAYRRAWWTFAKVNEESRSVTAGFYRRSTCAQRMLWHDCQQQTQRQWSLAASAQLKATAILNCCTCSLVAPKSLHQKTHAWRFPREMQRRMSNYPDWTCCFVEMSDSLSIAFRSIVIWVLAALRSSVRACFKAVSGTQREAPWPMWRLAVYDTLCVVASLWNVLVLLHCGAEQATDCVGEQLWHPAAVNFPRWRACHIV